MLDPGRREKLERLARATDRLRDRFGFSKVQFGGSLRIRDESRIEAGKNLRVRAQCWTNQSYRLITFRFLPYNRSSHVHYTSARAGTETRALTTFARVLDPHD